MRIARMGGLPSFDTPVASGQVAPYQTVGPDRENMRRDRENMRRE
jgi:hypothetical protein